MFDGYWDPCPFNPDPTVDALEQSWYHNYIFVNPPYSNPKPWVRKAIDTHREYGSVVVMLLKHDSSTSWFNMLHEAGARFIMFQGRLDFTGPDRCNSPKATGAPWPNVLAVMS